jgi:hypothetical protein
MLQSNLIVVYAQMRERSLDYCSRYFAFWGENAAKDILYKKRKTSRGNNQDHEKADLRACSALSSTEQERDMSSTSRLVYGEDHSTLYCDILP